MKLTPMIRLLPPEEYKRGPGGHWYCYEATDGVIFGYGQTAHEALREFEKKKAEAR